MMATGTLAAGSDWETGGKPTGLALD